MDTLLDNFLIRKALAEEKNSPKIRTKNFIPYFGFGFSGIEFSENIKKVSGDFYGRCVVKSSFSYLKGGLAIKNVAGGVKRNLEYLTRSGQYEKLKEKKDYQQKEYYLKDLDGKILSVQEALESILRNSFILHRLSINPEFDRGLKTQEQVLEMVKAQVNLLKDINPDKEVNVLWMLHHDTDHNHIHLLVYSPNRLTLNKGDFTRMKYLGAEKAFELTGEKEFNYDAEQRLKMVELAEKILGKGVFKEKEGKIYDINIDEVFGYAKGTDRKENFGISLLEKAQQHSEKGNLEKALEKLNKAIKVTPSNGTLYFERAEIYKTFGDWHRAVKNNTDQSLKSVLKGLSGTPEEDYRKAIKDYTQFLKLNPEYPKGYEARAVVYSELGIPKKAEKDLKQAQILREKHEQTALSVENMLDKINFEKVMKNEVFFMKQGIWIGHVKDGQAIGEGIFIQQQEKSLKDLPFAPAKVGFIQGNDFHCKSLTEDEKSQVMRKIQALDIERPETQKMEEEGKYLTSIQKNLRILERDIGPGVLTNAIGKVNLEHEKLEHFSGRGTVRVKDEGLQYTGEIEKGHFHGQGKFNFDVQHSKEEDLIQVIYEGEFVDGKRQGKGNIELQKCEMKEGNFVLKNTLKLETSWDDDFIIGKGKFTQIVGDNVVECIILEEKARELFGRYVKEGINLSDEYHEQKNLVFVSGLVKAEKGILESLKGDGTIQYADSKYTGELNHGKKEGYGKLIMKDGSLFEGEFSGNKFHGQGTVIFANGDKLEGRWIDGELESGATYQHRDGKVEILKYDSQGHLVDGKRQSNDLNKNLSKQEDIREKAKTDFDKIQKNHFHEYQNVYWIGDTTKDNKPVGVGIMIRKWGGEVGKIVELEGDKINTKAQLTISQVRELADNIMRKGTGLSKEEVSFVMVLERMYGEKYQEKEKKIDLKYGKELER
ncbi:MAG: MORN repeat protein [uncultured bacterium]|nr:MAG: MORN repeat protein [uncultured bacterium]